jgi:ribosome assembly protein YihI (activator of Der GTPase)
MGRKKSRKIGQIGIPKSSAPVVRAPSDRVRKKKGNKAGTRNSEAETGVQNSANKKKVDPRIGSKEPIDLLRHKTTKASANKPQKIKYKTPKDELDAIEADDKLQRLLDKAQDNKLAKLEQDYVDSKLARHKILCGLLGISMADEEEESEQEIDPLSALDAISMDDFKD